MTKLTMHERDYIGALVQLSRQTMPYRPVKRIPRRKLRIKPGTPLPIQSINGLPIKVAIQKMLEE